MRRRRVSAAEAKICGFSHEISAATFSKNEQLKNIIRNGVIKLNWNLGPKPKIFFSYFSPPLFGYFLRIMHENMIISEAMLNIYYC